MFDDKNVNPKAYYSDIIPRKIESIMETSVNPVNIPNPLPEEIIINSPSQTPVLGPVYKKEYERRKVLLAEIMSVVEQLEKTMMSHMSDFPVVFVETMRILYPPSN